MEKPKKWYIWDSIPAGTSRETVIDCKRCGTKQTYAIKKFFISSSNENLNKPDVIRKKLLIIEHFEIVQCNTCGKVTIYFKQDISGSGVRDPKLKPIATKQSIFPIDIYEVDVPEFIKDDFCLMYKCYEIDSSQGIAVHCRRIVDKLFSKYEKKYLTKEEQEKLNKKWDLEKRAKIIAKRSPHFKSLNITMKDLKGVVSTIIHEDEENFEIYADLKITKKDFDELVEIILAFVKSYELEFSILKNLSSRYKKIKETKKKNS